MDVHAATAETVARRAGAAHTTRAEDVFGDPSVDVIVICSPSQFHAAQVIAACRAGVKAILCEKPFAMTAEEANQIAKVSEETGVPIIVGAMHTFDPAWLAAEAEWGALIERSHTIRSSVVIPPNARFEDLATDIVARPSVSAIRRDRSGGGRPCCHRRHHGAGNPRPSADPSVPALLRGPGRAAR